MSIADEVRARHEAELKEAKLLDALVDAKASLDCCETCGRRKPTAKGDKRVAKYEQVKNELRAFRYEQRTARENV